VTPVVPSSVPKLRAAGLFERGDPLDEIGAVEAGIGEGGGIGSTGQRGPGGPEGHRGESGNGGAPFGYHLVEPVGGHHLVDQADPSGLVGIQAAGGKQEFGS
jgi:hypothetical protein